MKTKEGGNFKWIDRANLAGELPLIVPFRGEESACEQECISPRRVPCPVRNDIISRCYTKIRELATSCRRSHKMYRTENKVVRVISKARVRKIKKVQI